jgi:two-component system OmpR family sensor kinase
MRSLRRTALVWVTVVLGAVSVVAFVWAYKSAWQDATDFLDGELRQIALNAGERSSESPAQAAHPEPEDDFIIEIWDSSGESLRTAAVGLPRQPVGFSTINFGHEDWRVYRLDEESRTVQVAQRMVVRREMAEAAAYDAAVPLLVAAPLAWLVIGWSLGRVLGRVSSVAESIAERGIESREPISLEGVPTEVSPLVVAMNVLIERLQHAIEQQRQFVSDAAHELRTPLTALHLQIENLRAAAPANGGPDSTHAELRRGIARATTLLDQLLKMAKVELSGQAEKPERIVVSDLITRCVADHFPIASNKGIDLGLTAREPAEIWGVPAELSILFGNLIDNAVRYTQQGGVVDVSVRRSGAKTIIEVADTGCGVSEDHLPRLFDRFFRAAPAHIPGTGLGLSIVKAIAKRHDLAVSIENRQSGGLLVRVVSEDKAPPLIPP